MNRLKTLEFYQYLNAWHIDCNCIWTFLDIDELFIDTFVYTHEIALF